MDWGQKAKKAGQAAYPSSTGHGDEGVVIHHVLQSGAVLR